MRIGNLDRVVEDEDVGADQRGRRHGFTLVELLVVTIVAAALVALLLPAMSCGCGRGGTMVRDMTQLRGIQQSMLVFAGDQNGRMPTPSRIAAAFSPDPSQEDRSLNHSAALYSSLVMQNFFTPEVAISPAEPSELVTVDEDYDYDKFQPAMRVLWDESFQADPSLASNASYAHLALCGARLGNHWQKTLSSNMPHLATRGSGGGPFGLRGATSGSDYDRSITLEFFEPKNQWSGNVCFADNHVALQTGMTEPTVTYQPAGAATPLLDNFFAAEFMDAWVDDSPQPQASNDVWLGLFVEASADGRSCVPRFDPLKP